MSLLTQYGDSNKQTSTGLCVRYSCAEDAGWFVFTRYAEKTYAYVGMTYDCAKTCAAEKRTQYLRQHNRVTLESTTAGTVVVKNTPVYEALCSITMTHGEGDSWDVEIRVNEEEQRAAQSASTSPALLFFAENAWDYDEDGAAAGAISISAASGVVGETTVETTVASALSVFSPRNAILDVSAGTSSDIYTCKSLKKIADGTWTVTWGGSLALAADPTTVKVTFGVSTSDTFVFTPSEAS